MPPKNRNKNSNSNEKNSATPQDDVAKKSPKVSKLESAPVPGPSCSSGSGSGGLAKLISGLCYLALVAGAGFASFYVQQALTEVKQTNQRHQESIQKNAEVVQKVEQTLQQVRPVPFMDVQLMGMARSPFFGRHDREQDGLLKLRKCGRRSDTPPPLLLDDLAAKILTYITFRPSSTWGTLNNF